MAYTAMNADRLKQKSGVANTGRKATAGVVYSYSLSYHPEENPQKETMQNAALDVLEKLGLIEHEAVIVAHNDTEHPHVHVICNVVHPETGKTMAPSYDFLSMSKWAENLERENGKIYCEERVKNNERRRQEAAKDRQLALIKHREKKLQQTQLIQNLYSQSDSPKAFKAALEYEGLSLAKGDRRGFVLVDEQGKIHSLSRQLKGQRAKDIRERLNGIGELPNAKELSNKCQSFDHDQYETERQKKIVDAAINEYEANKNNTANSEIKKEQKKTDYALNPEKVDARKTTPKKEFGHVNNIDRSDKKSLSPTEKQIVENEKHLHMLDRIRVWEEKTQKAKDELKQRQEQQYSHKELKERKEELQNQLGKEQSMFAKLTGKRKDMELELHALQQNLNNINKRIEEQSQALEIKARQSHPGVLVEKERQKALDYMRQLSGFRNRSNDYGRSL